LFFRRRNSSQDDFSNEEEGEQYKELTESHSVGRMKIVFSIAVVVLSFLVFIFFKFDLGVPFIEATPTEKEIIANLSAIYGRVEVMTVKGNSMFPWLIDSQKVFVAVDYYKKGNPPLRGDIATIKFEKFTNPYIKRIVFVEGDSITKSGDYFYLDAESNTSVSGVTLKPGSVLYDQLAKYDYVMPKGTVVVLGDNLRDSVDSRDFGLVLVDKVIDKII